MLLADLGRQSLSEVQIVLHLFGGESVYVEKAIVAKRPRID